MIDVVLSQDQELAWDKIKSGKNLFVTARAGAGKSFLIDFIKENFMGRVITARQGYNVGGRIHSQFLISCKMDAQDSANKVDAGKNSLKVCKVVNNR